MAKSIFFHLIVGGKWRLNFNIKMFLSLILLTIPLSGCSDLVGNVAEKIYPALSQPNDMEAPSTFTTFPSSSNVEAILGGQGAGLDCSIPPVAKFLAFSSANGRGDVSLRFRQSCVMHDLCYRHGYATYGYSQADCDFQLQQSAYRICRQSAPADSKSDNPLEFYANCEQQAKKVLLGVRYGGAESFRDQTRSTYFEYDPAPWRADDYVVARAIDLPPTVSTDSDLGIRSFHYLRNTVTMRVIKRQDKGNQPEDDARDKSAPQIFPGVMLATPPVYSGLGADNSESPTTWVALARKTLTSSEVVPVFYQINGSVNDFSLLTCLNRIPCGMTSDVAITHIARVNNEAQMIGLSYRNGEKSNYTDDNKIYNNNKVPVNLAFIPTKVFKRTKEDFINNHFLNEASISNAYRFSSHDILLEKDAKDNATFAWAFGRGISWENGKNSSEDYASEVKVVRQALSSERNDNKPQHFVFMASEKDEPFSLVRFGDDKKTHLVSMAWSKDDLKLYEANQKVNNTPVLRVWDLPKSPNGGLGVVKDLILPLTVSNKAVAIPPVIARFSFMKEPLFVATEVNDDSWRACDKNSSECRSEENNSTILGVNFTLFKLKSNQLGGAEVSVATKLFCGVNLQQQNKEARFLNEVMSRLFKGYEKNNSSPSSINEKFDKMVTNYRYSLLAQRWRMSQLIVAERKFTDINNAIAISLVFNGFPGMTIQLLLQPDNMQGFSILPESPLPDFATCKVEKT